MINAFGYIGNPRGREATESLVRRMCDSNWCQSLVGSRNVEFKMRDNTIFTSRLYTGEETPLDAYLDSKFRFIPTHEKLKELSGFLQKNPMNVSALGEVTEEGGRRLWLFSMNAGDMCFMDLRLTAGIIVFGPNAQFMRECVPHGEFKKYVPNDSLVLELPNKNVWRLEQLPDGNWRCRRFNYPAAFAGKDPLVTAPEPAPNKYQNISLTTAEVQRRISELPYVIKEDGAARKYISSHTMFGSPRRKLDQLSA